MNLPVIVDRSRIEFGYYRTVCACPSCQVGCQTMPAYLIPADVHRLMLATFDNEASVMEWAEKHLLASPGPLVAQRGRMYRIPTLVPASVKGGACHWLKDGQCSVHVAAPFGCAFFDSHQSGAEGNERSGRGLNTIMEDVTTDGPYYRVWKHLHDKGLVAEDIVVRRRRMNEKTAEVESGQTSTHGGGGSL